MMNTQQSTTRVLGPSFRAPGKFARVDLTLRLREVRRRAGLRQCELARKSGIGEKTISSFETGARTSAISVAQLMRILDACGVRPTEFFAENFLELPDMTEDTQ